MLHAAPDAAAAWALTNALLGSNQEATTAIHPMVPCTKWQKLDVHGMCVSRGGLAKLAALSAPISSSKLQHSNMHAAVQHMCRHNMSARRDKPLFHMPAATNDMHLQADCIRMQCPICYTKWY